MAQALATAVGTSRSARYRRAMEGLFIRSETGVLAPMRFSQSQEIIWSHIAPRLDNREKVWCICLKARQIYSSTFFCALTFVRTLESAGTHSIVLAHDLFTSHELFDRVKTFYDHLPLPKLRSPRVNELIFPFQNGTSKYRVISAGSVAKGRGTTQTAMLMSELPSWPHPDIATGLFQAMPDLADTFFIEESTARGKSGPGRLFYEEWNRATRGESDLAPIFVPWFVMRKYRRSAIIRPDDWDDREKLLAETFGGPTGLSVNPDKSKGIDLDEIGRQLAWRRYAIQTKCQGLVDNFDQEFPESPAVAFIASGQPAFDRLILMKQQANIRPPVTRLSLEGGKRLATDSRGEVRVWKHPEAGHEYAIGADTSEGIIGGDYACAQIIDCRTMEQVASIHGLIPPYEFAQLLNAVGIYYNRAWLCIEVWPQGHRVQDHLIREFFYPNLHRWRGKPDKVKFAPTRLYGWETNVWSRPLLVGAGQRALNHNLVTVHEDGLLEELMNFSKSDVNDKYEAEYGHDDRVMALLLALRSREENFVDRTSAPSITDQLPGLPTAIRIVDAGHFDHRWHDADGKPAGGHMISTARRQLSKILRAKADNAIRSWMSY